MGNEILKDIKETVDTNCVTDTDAMLRKAEENICKLTCELKEREAEKAFYIKENDFLKEVLQRLIGTLNSQQ